MPGAAAKRSNDYRPQNGPRRRPSPISTPAGRRPAPTPSPAPERPGHNAVVAWILALRLVICERGRRRSPHMPRPLVSVAATRRSAPVAAAARGATASCTCKPPRIGPSASTSTTLATTAKRVGGQVAHDARVAGEATSCASGETHVSRLARGEPCPWVGASILASVAGVAPSSDRSRARTAPFAASDGSFRGKPVPPVASAGAAEAIVPGGRGRRSLSRASLARGFRRRGIEMSRLAPELPLAAVVARPIAGLQPDGQSAGSDPGERLNLWQHRPSPHKPKPKPRGPMFSAVRSGGRSARSRPARESTSRPWSNSTRHCRPRR
jgi:hypothetical protein